MTTIDGRPTIPQVMLGICLVLAQRATCSKLAVGCVLVDEHNRIIGTGYNGVARGQKHCTDIACPGAYAPRGADLCEAIHAEQNALLVCRNPDDVRICYTTHAPCLRCTKLLLNTGCQLIHFLDGDYFEPAARRVWEDAGRQWWIHIPGDRREVLRGVEASPRL